MHFALPLFLFITIHSLSCLAVLCSSLSLEHTNLRLSKLKQTITTTTTTRNPHHLKGSLFQTWGHCQVKLGGACQELKQFCTASVCCWGFSRFQTANPEGWDGSFLSSMSMWGSIAELRKPAQLSAALVGSNLAQPVELWACVPAILFTSLHSHPSWALFYQCNFDPDFHQIGAGCAESLLLSCP